MLGFLQDEIGSAYPWHNSPEVFNCSSILLLLYLSLDIKFQNTYIETYDLSYDNGKSHELLALKNWDTQHFWIQSDNGVLARPIK